jgi:ketosteroid isomerase-like protein
MNLRSALWLSLALLLAPAPALAQSLSPSGTVDAFHYAMKSGDRRKVLEFMAADVLVFEQGRLEHSRTEYARQHLGEDIRFAATTQLIVSRRSEKITGNTAWITSVYRNRGKYENKPVDLTNDETMVLMRVNGKWRIQHIHWSFDDHAAAR